MERSVKALFGIFSSQSDQEGHNNGNPIVALLGNTGVGKTLIYNKLCNTSHATKYSKDSLTFEIRLNDVAHGNYKYQILDTPGNNA
jgi:predicted GTPase